MPAPTNTSALTAIDIGTTLPYSVVQTVDDAGVTYDVWYSYTAQSGDNEIGLWAFGDLAVYTPTLTIHTGPASAPVPYLSITAPLNVPAQIPVTPGTTYYFKIATNAGNPTPAVLTLSVLRHTDVLAPIGSIGVNDDTDDYPLVLCSDSVDNTVLAFVQNIVAGENGDVLSDGSLLLDKNSDNTLHAYDSTYTEVATNTQPATAILKDIRGNRVDKFYALYRIGAQAFIYTYNSSAVVLDQSIALTNVTGAAAKGVAVSPDGTIAYVQNTSTGKVVRWDLVNDVALTDLVTGLSTTLSYNVLCLADGSVVVGAAGNNEIRIYSAAGALLVSIPEGALGVNMGFDDRMCYDTDDAYFWYRATNGALIGKFFRIKASDGSIERTRTMRFYEAGMYQGAATATPDTRYGPSESCTFWITHTPLAPPATVVRLTQLPIEAAYGYRLIQSNQNAASLLWNTPVPPSTVT